MRLDVSDSNVDSALPPRPAEHRRAQGCPPTLGGGWCTRLQYYSCATTIGRFSGESSVSGVEVARATSVSYSLTGGEERPIRHKGGNRYVWPIFRDLT
jgi:hypothetical protein